MNGLLSPNKSVLVNLKRKKNTYTLKWIGMLAKKIKLKCNIRHLGNMNIVEYQNHFFYKSNKNEDIRKKNYKIRTYNNTVYINVWMYNVILEVIIMVDIDRTTLIA